MRQSLRILLLDDDIVDATSLRRAVERSGLRVEVQRVRDGIEALESLRDPASTGPDVILTDLRMPRMDGLEFLDAKATDATLPPIPVVVLTSSSDPRDRDACYRRGAGGFVCKPADTNGYDEVLRRLFGYWTMCDTPGSSAAP